VIDEPSPCVGTHLGVRLLVDTRVGVEVVRADAEELENACVDRGRVGRELLARQDEQLLARKDRQPALQLLRVAAARQVRVIPPRRAPVAGLAGETLLLPPRPLGLGGNRVLERERLAAERDLVVVVRERAVDRVTQQSDQLRVRDRLGDTLRRERVEEIARARLADDPPARAGGKVATVPAASAAVVSVEVADLLPRRARDLRVPAQVGVQRRRAGFLGAEDQEVGQRARERRQAPGRPDGVAEDGAEGPRDPRNQLGGESLYPA
jgi:hypothetical protein